MGEGEGGKGGEGVAKVERVVRVARGKDDKGGQWVRVRVEKVGRVWQR